MLVTTKVLGLEMPGKFVFSRHTEKKRKILANGRFTQFVEYTGNYFEFLKFCRSGAWKTASSEIKQNVKQIQREFSDEGSKTGFAGGTYEELISQHSDFKPFHKATKKISSSKLWKQISHDFAESRTRKRARSAYDGDYDHDKRFDFEPFTRRQVKPSVARIVKLFIDGSYNCGVENESINEFAGFIGAIINLLEKNGVLVEVHASHSGQNIYGENPYSTASGYTADLLVKRADEYLPIGNILKVLSSNWHRRANFAVITAASDFVGEPVADGLGCPLRFGKCWEKKGNEVFIYSAPDQSQQEDILKKLCEVVGN